MRARGFPTTIPLHSRGRLRCESITVDAIGDLFLEPITTEALLTLIDVVTWSDYPVVSKRMPAEW